MNGDGAQTDPDPGSTIAALFLMGSVEKDPTTTSVLIVASPLQRRARIQQAQVTTGRRSVLAPMRTRQLLIDFDDLHQVWHLTAPGTVLLAAGEMVESPPAAGCRTAEERARQGGDNPSPVGRRALLANGPSLTAAAPAVSGNTIADDSRTASSSGDGAGSNRVAGLPADSVGATSGSRSSGHGQSDGDCDYERGGRTEEDGGGSAAAVVATVGFVEENRRAAEVRLLVPDTDPVMMMMMVRATCANRLCTLTNEVACITRGFCYGLRKGR